jgi:hypothetical protein
MRVPVLVVLLTLATVPCLAGDYCVVVCDSPTKPPELRICPSPTFRTSREIADDFRGIAAGTAPSWPFGAFANGFFSWCTAAEHRALMGAVVEAIPLAGRMRRRDLVSFACRVGPRDALAAIEEAVKSTELPAERRHAFEQAEATVRGCVRSAAKD